MTEEQPSGRAFFERQQQRRREMQARLTSAPPNGEIPESGPPTVPPAGRGEEDQQAAGSVPAEQRGRAKPSARPEPETWAEPSVQPEPETRVEPSALPEPESRTEPSAPPEPESRTMPSAPPEQALRLVVTRGSNVGQMFGLHPHELIIGREEGSDIHLDDLTVSHNHALLRRHGEVVTIEDLRSKNGTMVNGAPISRPVSITPGDLIMVGAVELLFEQYQAGQG